MASLLKTPLFWLAAFVSAALVVLVCYDFGYSDDYLYAYWFGHLGMETGLSQFFMHGRFMLHYLMEWVFTHVHTVPDMAYIRVCAVVGVICFGAVAYRLGRYLGLSRNSSALLGIVGSLNPATMVFLGFASTYSYPWVAALAVWLNRRFLEKTEGFSLRTWIASAYCVGVLLLVLLVYQPMAFLFLIPVTLAVIVKGAERKRLLMWALSLAILVVSVGIYTCYIKIIGSWAYSMQPGYLRGGFDFDLVRKGMVIFSTGVVPTLKSWGIFSSYGYAVLGVQLGLAICGVVWKGGIKRALVNLVVAVVCLGALFGPVIASKDVFMSFRILHGVYFFFAGLAVLGLVNLLSLRRKGEGSISMVVTLVVAGVVAASSLHYFYWGIVEPHHREYTRYRDYMFTHFKERPVLVSFYSGYLIDFKVSVIPEHMEYGTIASKAAWSHVGIVDLIVNEKFGFDSQTPLVAVESCHHTLIGSAYGDTFLDADAIIRGTHSIPASQQQEGALFEDPCFGELIKTGPDSYFSMIYGTIDSSGYPMLHVEKIGKGKPAGKIGTGFWFYHDKGRMLQIDRSLFPIVYDVAADKWLYVSEL